MRVAAAVSGCAALIQAFEEGLDAHDTTTRLVWAIDERHPEWKRNRNVAKRLNFGTVYGAGARTIADQVLQFTGIEMAESEAQALLTRFRSVYPEIPRASRRFEREWQRRGFLVLPGGRRRYLTVEERDRFEQRKAFNAMIQGGVAEGMKIAMIEVERQLPGMLLGQVHDSLIMREPEDQAGAQVAKACDITTEVFTALFGVPFTMDQKRWWPST
jgi:DNA polymerase I-like protein with 3'-5' exonuclease and polymerase domains